MEDFSKELRRLLSRSRGVSLALIECRSIDRFMKRFSDVHWRPNYLLLNLRDQRFIALSVIYEADSFPSILSQEVEKATRELPFDFFFILQEEELLDIFEENCRSSGFGLILNKNQLPNLIRDSGKSSIVSKIPEDYIGHYPQWIIDEIQNINMGNSKLRTALKDFSKEYLSLKKKCKLDEQMEVQLVKNTINEILKSDARYTSGIDSFSILSRFESFWTDIRDHYFHSFCIFLLGLLIINRYKAEFTGYFKNLFWKYPSFSLEFSWLLTAIFHDVGYPISKIDDIKKSLYGVPIDQSERQTTNVWDDPIYKENLKQVLSLFKFSLDKTKHKIDWRPEVFGIKDDGLERIFRESFYDSHGVAGCFRFLIDIFSEARREEDFDRRTFLINHIYPAALSIALHDRRFQERLNEAGIHKINLSRFPFAVLLLYLDSIQEDKRDKYLSIESPELLEGFQFNGKVMARINKEIAENYPRLGKLKAECRNFKDFVECDGVQFQYPEILSL